MTSNAVNQEIADRCLAVKKAGGIVVWTDGCFDMMHYGHANALRQSRELGTFLVVGVHSDEEIRKNKGPPVMTEEERYLAVEACKWADAVVRDAPYVTSLAVLDQYHVDFCVHGDDLVSTSDGTDCYHEVKQAGRFRTVKRTEGVSTTDLVGRMLLMTKSHHRSSPPRDADLASMAAGQAKHSPYTGVSHFITTSRKIVQFSNSREAKPTDKIVYIDGAWDLFHVGHVEALRVAKQLGDYLLVGIHDDHTINRAKGENHPLMNVHERVLSVLSCKYVDEVIIGAPWCITPELIEKLHISVVVHGSADLEDIIPLDGQVPYEEAKAGGVFQIIQSPSTLTTGAIIDRIIANRLAFETRNRKKEMKELQAINEEKDRVKRQRADDAAVAANGK
eukprot:TRINITY_DN2805_c0_g1_i1.p1 TRINITY_DN2805_c0_g1~~TRINITY_DN2805_c0_g1_i1.p1  ORF type:complete len:391 (+),score=126.48 TRINITY_DN2805_c0_g1_i1:103-1275(+)